MLLFSTPLSQLTSRSSRLNQPSSFAAAILRMWQVSPFGLGDFTWKSQEIQADFGGCAVA